MSEVSLRTRILKNGIFRGSASVIGIKLLNSCIGVITTAFFARVFPPSDLGSYLFFVTVAQFLALPLQMGVPTLLSREIAIYSSQSLWGYLRGILVWSRNVIFGAWLILSIVAVVSILSIDSLNNKVSEHGDVRFVLGVLFLFPIIALLKRQSGILIGLKRPALALLPDSVIRPLLLLFLASFGVFFLDLGYFELFLFYTVSSVFAFIFGVWFLKFTTSHIPLSEAQFLKREWTDSLWPLTIFAVADTLKIHSDILMLGFMDSPEELAFYRLATQIAMLAMLVQVAVNSVLGPRVAASYANFDASQIHKIAVLGSRIAFFVTMIFAFVLLLIGSDGIAMVLGEEYREVFKVSVFLAFGMSLTTVFGGTVLVLNMTRREKDAMSFALWTTFLNIMLNLVLIPVLGALGAAISTVVTTLLMKFLAWNRVRLQIGVRTDAFARRAR